MIPIAKPLLGNEEAGAVRDAIMSGWVAQGPMVEAFENTFARAVGARHACAVSNGTAALHLALLAAGVMPGDVVITVSHSFIATANAVRHCGAEPLFIDIEPDTYNMDPQALLQVLTDDCTQSNARLYYKHIGRIAKGDSPLAVRGLAEYPAGRVAAIMPVHQMGIPCDISAIRQAAQLFSLPVIEDAACAVGSTVSLNAGEVWENVGRPHGDIACFSFHPRKLITTGEGGMITTNDSSLDQKYRLLRQHGMSIPGAARHSSPSVVFETYLMSGFNYRLSDIHAAVGMAQMERLPAMLSERNALARLYHDLLGATEHLKLFTPPAYGRTNWQSYPVQLTDDCRLHQTDVMEKLLARGISCRRGIMNAHQEPPYLAAGWVLPHSEKARDRTILLPLFNGMSADDVHFVASALREILL